MRLRMFVLAIIFLYFSPRILLKEFSQKLFQYL